MAKGWYTAAEGTRLAELAQGAQMVVEVGTAYGRSVSFILSSDAEHVTCVDTWSDGHVYAEFRALIAAQGWDTRVTPLQMVSRDAARNWTIPIDLLHIDASHVHEDVLADFQDWSPHVVVGGWLAFHDSQWIDVRRVIRQVGPDWVDRKVVGSLWTARRA